MREKLLEFLLGLFPLLGVAVPSLLAFKRRLESERYQSGGIGLYEATMASLSGLIWAFIGFLFVALIIKLLELKGIPATDYIRRFWS